jgi:hypothetical protein
MRYYMDWEFIEGHDCAGVPTFLDPISVGVVCQDGREIHRVSHDCNHSRMTDWHRQNVLPHLPPRESGIWKTRPEIAADLKDFIRGDRIEIWTYFGGYDWVCLCQLYGTMMQLPEHFPMQDNDLLQFARSLGVSKHEIKGSVPKPADAHSALADARWNRQLHQYLRQRQAQMLWGPPGMEIRCRMCGGIGVLPNRMDAPSGPVCACGRPSVHESGQCAEAHEPVPCPWCLERKELFEDRQMEQVLTEERQAILDEFEELAKRWDKSLEDYVDHKAYSIAADCQAHAKSLRSAAEIVSQLVARRDTTRLAQKPSVRPSALTEEELSTLQDIGKRVGGVGLEPATAAEHQHVAVLVHHGLVETHLDPGLCWRITEAGRLLLRKQARPAGNVCRFPCTPSCTRVPIKGLTMCRKHQPYPAKQRRRR